jgi:succinate dehydrogenase/fumarate reductase flavoprotein subunit
MIETQVIDTGGRLQRVYDAIETGKISLDDPAPRGGFDTTWVTQQIQNNTFPYYILCIRHADRLKAALTNVDFLRDHISPLIFARDFHGLRLAHETKNRILGAEMMLRSALFRKESRGKHYREDYPRR